MRGFKTASGKNKRAGAKHQDFVLQLSARVSKPQAVRTNAREEKLDDLKRDGNQISFKTASGKNKRAGTLQYIPVPNLWR